MSAEQRILVTGAGGFLGRRVVALARENGLEVVAGCRSTRSGKTISIDVCDASSVDAAFRESLPSVVIHCAAYGVNYADGDLRLALDVNVHGALSVLAAAARYGVRRFVHIGSCFEYGSVPSAISEDAPLNPTAVYGASKAAGTLLLRERAHALGVPLVVARPFGIWGEGEGEHRLVPQVIRACISRSPLDLTACEVVRDYMYVDDMAANILALSLSSRVEAGDIVNLGTGRGVVLREFVLSIAQLLSGAELLRFGARAYRSTEMLTLVADVRRMHALIGSGPTTPLSEGVRRMWTVYAQNHAT